MSSQGRKDGEIHRDNDLPAVIEEDGTKRWYQNGRLHRDDDLPAVIWADGAQEWYQNGELQPEGELDGGNIKG